MKFIKTISAFCVALFMAMTLAACAPTPTNEGTGGYIDDTVVTTKVKTALLNTKDLKSTQISVETFKGRVQLSGFVSSQEDINKAVNATRKVPGVTSVVNSLRVK